MVCKVRLLRWAAWGIAVSMSALGTSTAQASINWDGGGNTNWWFNPVNWSQDGGCATGTDPCYIPPIQDSGGVAARNDAQINTGSGAWDITGEGVVYDPINDPFFADAADLTFVTGSPLATTPGYMRDYGPETVYRLYISRNTTSHNLLTIKSGDLVIESTTIVGRSGSTGSAAEQQNLGTVVQTGGSFRLPLTALDIGQRETSGWGNGVYDYRGGILEVSALGGNGLRLSPGGGAGTGGQGRFIMHNPTSGGRVRAFDYVSAANGTDGDGVLTGVGITEFHFENGGTRPIQVIRNLSINNGLDSDLAGVRSSRLELVLDAAPTVDGSGVPQNLGLFDVDFDQLDFEVGLITGTGDLDGDMLFDNDRVFSNADASVHYREGDTVSASLGSTKYNWTISYTGNITWTDADNSIVDMITGSGTGTDVVLIGLSSEVLPGLDGDYNNDGKVDAADYTVWRDNLGAADESSINNNGDGGDVGAGDYTLWKSQFGMPGSGSGGLATSAVPEPASSVLVLATLLGFAGFRGRNA